MMLLSCSNCYSSPCLRFRDTVKYQQLGLIALARHISCHTAMLHLQLLLHKHADSSIFSTLCRLSMHSRLSVHSNLSMHSSPSVHSRHSSHMAVHSRRSFSSINKTHLSNLALVACL